MRKYFSPRTDTLMMYKWQKCPLIYSQLISIIYAIKIQVFGVVNSSYFDLLNNREEATEYTLEYSH